MTELTACYDTNPILIANWKRSAREQVLSSMTCKPGRHEAFREAEIEERSN